MSTPPLMEASTESHAAATPGLPFLICLPSMTPETAPNMYAELSQMCGNHNCLIASPDVHEEEPATAEHPALVPYPEPRETSDWVVTRQDYASTARLASERRIAGALIIGPEVASLRPQALRAMHHGLAQGADLAIPVYQTSVDEALVNSALLYPLTRALFAVDVRFPLPIDVGLSSRLLARIAQASQRARPGEDRLLWPVAEASIAGFTIRQVEAGPRVLPQPGDLDLNALFPIITSSLFTDLEEKATFWQRARAVPGRRAIDHLVPATTMSSGEEKMEDVGSLVEGYRMAFNNLREIWALVLPPQTLLALKKLSGSSPEAFVFPQNLWARIIYDFALAFHLRTLNRGHLLGALTPLYLAWVASFLRNTSRHPQGGQEVLELTATAFEQEKPYLVARWRWPDRFNP